MDLLKGIEQLITTSIREGASSLRFEEIVGNKENLSRAASQPLEQRRRDWGVLVRVDLQSLQSAPLVARHGASGDCDA